MKTEENILTETINDLQPSANVTGELEWDTCIEAMKRYSNQINKPTLEEFKKALIEASEWQYNLNEYEKTSITFFEARNRVIDRIFDKYKTKI